MKQFIVDRHTTPNTPTLEQVPTEKIPVYDDIDAAAADLANLAENQIIATHDTGSELSAPVDTVQSGNMHAVSSNAVANHIKMTTVTISNLTIGNNGYTNIESYKPSDITTLLCTTLWNWGSASIDTKFIVNGDGRYIRGTAGNVIDSCIIAYIYI